jgi:hypothetical protein
LIVQAAVYRDEEVARGGGCSPPLFAESNAMWIIRRRVGAVTLAGVAVLALAVPHAQGQFFRQRTLPVYSPGVNPFSPFYNVLNPTQRIAPGVTSQQALYAYGQAARAVSMVPPWVYGYNPYPSPIIAGGPGLGGYSSPYYPGYSNPYGGYGGFGYGGGPGYGGGGPPNMYGQGIVDPSNPYAAALTTPPDYGSGYNPYSYDPYSGFLYGTASVIKAQGQLMQDQERARIMRELALQARQKTRKEKFDTDRYIADHTPTFTQEQEKIARERVKRIQSQASPGEIESGRAMNILLDDLRKHADKMAGVTSAPLDEDVLKRINITTPSGANLGLLRNGGNLNWPTALVDLVPAKTREDIESLTGPLYQLAVTNKLTGNNLVRDLDTRVDQLQDALAGKVDEIPTGQYLEAKRFLRELRSAVTALQQPGVAPAMARYQKFVSGGGKTAEQVAKFLIDNGLTVAPATPGDEAAYNALHTALANYDVGVNAQTAVASKQ